MPGGEQGHLAIEYVSYICQLPEIEKRETKLGEQEIPPHAQINHWIDIQAYFFVIPEDKQRWRQLVSMASYSSHICDSTHSK